MLVLSRRVGESIILTSDNGYEVTITVTDIIGAKVRIGITAPLKVKVLRSELLDESTDESE